MFLPRSFSYGVSLVVTLLAIGGCRSNSDTASVIPAADSMPGGPVVEPPSDRETELAVTLARLPSGVPPVALVDEREREALLAVSEENRPFWPFAEGAPATSGTGRYAHGAYYWTDFLYDANGAIGPNPPLHRATMPTGGTMSYPDEPTMAHNGADIFRVGIAADAFYTYWRVDWQTLVEPSVPIAAFALDFDPPMDSIGPAPSVEEWPGVPRLLSPGVDAVLLVSATGVLLDDGSGSQREVGEVRVDRHSQAFLARVPHKALGEAPEQIWRIRLASGINDSQGNFRDTMSDFNALPAQPPVFNLAFRDYQDEPASNNFWFNLTQARELTLNNAAPFFIDLDWQRLGETEAEPVVLGYSSRWYVSSTGPEYFGRAGIDAGSDPLLDLQYFDRVQPYGLYVPTSYDSQASESMPLTLMLHSLGGNHNQYGTGQPHFVDVACKQRQSVCVTTLGRAPGGWYQREAELDIWEAWHNVARYFPLDPERSIASGYSMGAGGSFSLVTKYPDVFAGGVFLAGRANFPDIGDVTAQLENLKWTGYYQAHGTFDQLVPFADALAGAERMEALGYRYVFDHYVLEDHVLWAQKDAAIGVFEEAAYWMAEMAAVGRKRSPGDFVFRWRDDQVDTLLGIGPGSSGDGPWWISELRAAPGASESVIRAHSIGRPELPVIATCLPDEPLFSVETPTPGLRYQQVWSSAGAVPASGGRVTLELQGVAALGLDMAGAGVAERNDKLLCLHSDTPVSVVLYNLPRDVRVAGTGGIDQVVTDSAVSFHTGAGAVAVTFSDSNTEQPDQACGFD